MRRGLPALELGYWSSIEQVRTRFADQRPVCRRRALAPFLAWVLKNTRWGLILRLAGESEEAAAAMGYSVPRIRIIATAIGGALAGIGGSYLSLVLPRLVERADFLRPGVDGRGPGDFCPLGSHPLPVGFALVRRRRARSVRPCRDRTWFRAPCAYLWYAAPYILTLFIMIVTCSRLRAMVGAPAELSKSQ